MIHFFIYYLMKALTHGGTRYMARVNS